MGILDKIKNISKVTDEYLDTTKLVSVASNELAKTRIELRKIEKKHSPATNFDLFMEELKELKLEIGKDFKDLDLEQMKIVSGFVKEDLDYCQKRMLEIDKEIKPEELQTNVIGNIAGKIVLEVCEKIIAEKTKEQTAGTAELDLGK